MSNGETGKTTSSKGTSGTANSLGEFLEALKKLPASVEKGMLSVVQDDDEAAVVSAYAAPLKKQVAELCDYISEKASGASRRATSEVADVLRIGSAMTLVAQANSLSANPAADSARFGIAGLFDMIKKVLMSILEIFGIKLPSWLISIFDLINEIARWLLSGGNSRLQGELSKSNQNYLAELTQLARLKRESQWKYSDTGDDD